MSYKNGDNYASIDNSGHAELSRMHSEADAFVKREQEKTAKYAGREPKMEAKFMRLDAEMMITGAKAKEFGRKLTEGLDKDAYPVR